MQLTKLTCVIDDMTAITNQNGGAQPQINAPPHTDSVGDHDRNFKQESNRNKRLRKADKRRRAEKWDSPCSI
jgi:hypothetical protein